MEQIRVNSDRPYEVYCGSGALDRLAEDLPKSCPGIGSACLVCDETVAALYASRAEQLLRGLGYAVSRFSFPEVDDPESLSVYERLVGHLRQTGHWGDCLLVAMGGSGLLNLVGFTAGTYRRGLRFAEIPTTLTAMIAPRMSGRYCLTVGGAAETAGVAVTPACVVCDTEFLATLPDSHMRSGYAYVVRDSLLGFDEVTKSLPKIRDLTVPEPGSSVPVPSEELVIACVGARAAAENDAIRTRTVAESNAPVTKARQEEEYRVLGDDLAAAIREASGFEVSRGYALASALGVMAQFSVSEGQCDRKRYRYLATRLMQYGLPTGTSELWETIRDRLDLCAERQDDAEDNEEAFRKVAVVRDIGWGYIKMRNAEYIAAMARAMGTCRTICAGVVKPGEVIVPYAKELVIRMALAWFLDGFSLLDLSEMPGDDIGAMGKCLRELLSAEENPLPCGESATVFRLLLPLMGALDIESVRMSLGAGLFLRPHEGFCRILTEHGMKITVYKEQSEYVVEGQLEPGEFVFSDKNAAEQVCGLLFTLPLLHGESTITVPKGMYRKNLINLTINVLHTAGVSVEITEDGYRIEGDQRYDRFGLRNITPERDWSVGAVFETLSYITGEPVEVFELPKASMQAERVITEFLDTLRRAVNEGETEVRLELADYPNLIPCVALAASLTDGVTVTIAGLEVLADREGNRMQSIAMVLATLGADIRIERVPTEDEEGETDAYIIEGRGCLNGGIVDSMGDHRIAMTAAIAAWGCEQPVTVTDADAVNRSFPEFYEELEKLI
ncbi:MAG: hypothetical protein IK055_06720 [Lachnospiraceae bacterium]|nr:hypothetical protein [Lachnospiraceae bacterium]